MSNNSYSETNSFYCKPTRVDAEVSGMTPTRPNNKKRVTAMEAKEEKKEPWSFKPLRYVSGEMIECHKILKDLHPILELFENCFRGIGQIVFLNNPITGLFLFIGLAVYSWFAAICAFIGTNYFFFRHVVFEKLIFNSTSNTIRCIIFYIISTLFPNRTLIDRTRSLRGALVGAVVGIFSKSPFHEDTPKDVAAMFFSQILFTIVLSAYCPFITSFWGKLMNSLGTPGLTMGYNIVSAAFLLSTYSFGYTSPNPTIMYPHLNAPREVEVNGTIVETEILTMIAPSYGEDELLMKNIYEAWFRSIGQIFFADSAASGILILIGVFLASRKIGCACVVGTTASILTAVAVGVDGVAIYHGLWGYNGALGCMVVLTFCALSVHAVAVSVFCAIASTLALGLFRGLFAPLGIPSLTFPYNVVAVTILALRSKTDARARLKDITLEDATSSSKSSASDVELPDAGPSL